MRIFWVKFKKGTVKIVEGILRFITSSIVDERQQKRRNGRKKIRIFEPTFVEKFG